ncbi:MAG: hypothetical protein ACYCPT_11985, partial [Acidimicrobiales bacterium]
GVDLRPVVWTRWSYLHVASIIRAVPKRVTCEVSRLEDDVVRGSPVKRNRRMLANRLADGDVTTRRERLGRRRKVS